MVLNGEKFISQACNTYHAFRCLCSQTGPENMAHSGPFPGHNCEKLQVCRALYSFQLIFIHSSRIKDIWQLSKSSLCSQASSTGQPSAPDSASETAYIHEEFYFRASVMAQGLQWNCWLWRVQRHFNFRFLKTLSDLTLFALQLSFTIRSHCSEKLTSTVKLSFLAFVFISVVLAMLKYINLMPLLGLLCTSPFGTIVLEPELRRYQWTGNG